MMYFDIETYNTNHLELKTVGVMRYQQDIDTHTSLFQYAFDDGPVNYWRPGMDVPQDVINHVESDGLCCAYNAQFDRLHWQYVLTGDHGFPRLATRQVLCAQSQAEASNLPAGLGRAGQSLGLKIQKGTMNHQLYWRAPTEEEYPDLIAYGVADVEVLRSIYNATRKLSREEHIEYVVSEMINDRGLPIDRGLAKTCHIAFNHLKESCDEEYRQGTDGIRMSQNKATQQWLLDNYGETEAVNVLRKLVAGKPTSKLSLDTYHRTLARAEADCPEAVEYIFDLLDQGGGQSGHKFARALERTDREDPRVYGAYVYNGAGQTGRFASRGLQMHNLYRGAADEDDVPAVLENLGAWNQYHNNVTRDMPTHGWDIGETLKSLLRPMVCSDPASDDYLVWGDYSQIEARLAPYMADSKSSSKVMDVFASGADPYITDAAYIYGIPEANVSKEQRQSAKVAHLALQFGGGAGALLAMARGYGLDIKRPDAESITNYWKDANPWVRAYMDQLWDAAHIAMERPGEVIECKRLRFVFQKKMLGGSLMMVLPCGRPLMYAGAKFRTEHDEERDWDREVLRTNRGALWAGTLVENSVQGYAASLLRAALVRCEVAGLNVVGHIHDEILVETPEPERDAEILQSVMEFVPAHGVDLDTPADVDWGSRYGK